MVNLFTFVGDAGSRRLAYNIPNFQKFSRRLQSVVLALMCSMLGACLVCSLKGIAAPLGMFLVFFSNGLIYACSTRHIDLAISSRFNLVALSVWLFVGDIGSVIGAELIDWVRALACGTAPTYPHVCLATN